MEAKREKQSTSIEKILAPYLTGIKDELPPIRPPTPQAIVKVTSNADIKNLISSAEAAEVQHSNQAPYAYELILKKLGVGRRFSKIGEGTPYVSSKDPEEIATIKYFAERGAIIAEKFEDVELLKDFKMIIRVANLAESEINAKTKHQLLPEERLSEFKTIISGKNVARISNDMIFEDIPKIYQADHADGSFLYINRFEVCDSKGQALTKRSKLNLKFQKAIEETLYEIDFEPKGDMNLGVSIGTNHFRDKYVLCALAMLDRPPSREEKLFIINLIDSALNKISEDKTS